MKDFARTTRCHSAEIVAYLEHLYTSAVFKGADNVIQNTKRRARGSRNINCLVIITHLTCNRLGLRAVTIT